MDFSKIDHRYLGHIVKVVSEILGDQTMVLQRVERAFQEQTKAYKALSQQLDQMDQKVDGGFNVMENNRIASLDKIISQRISAMQYDNLKQMKYQLDSICIKLQQQIQMQLLQFMIKQARVQQEKPPVPAPVVTPTSPISASRTAAKPSPPVPKGAEPVKAEAPTPVQQGEWTDSELEGAEIFDTIIVGWKRKDWETAKGTKEEFMRAWKKLSHTDKQKVRQGAWSKPIIDKMKMLGREI
ncbi:MAG: hypothetical protein LUQ65_14960 [Candidatus Helarchaeota archaeon]|nr:hypothetical protein [Candidatus Helarchaeota archaeon]